MAAKDRPITGINGLPLPVLPPDRDPRVWIKMVRVMFFTPGFLALLLIKAGEPLSFGITVELLILSSASAVVAGLFVGTQPMGGGADSSSRVGLWSGALILEFLSTVPFLCAVPPLFHELAHSALLHAGTNTGRITTVMGPSELLPFMAILPFMIYQLVGFGTLSYLVSRRANWMINIGALILIISGYLCNRLGLFDSERIFVGLLIISMGAVVVYGIMKLRKMQIAYDANVPPTPKPEKVEAKPEVRVEHHHHHHTPPVVEDKPAAAAPASTKVEKSAPAVDKKPAPTEDGEIVPTEAEKGKRKKKHHKV